ncbi:hypothetical protein V6N12_043584 [Hibiscus sabdariffa]|uniref:Secreted protein n=1 Tax=Hibiscus sabdariffa TaxID=183260 RepID=A0ABR2DER5_9ROSI
MFCKKLILIISATAVNLVQVVSVIQMPLPQSSNHITHRSRKQTRVQPARAFYKETNEDGNARHKKTLVPSAMEREINPQQSHLITFCCNCLKLEASNFVQASI